MNDLQQTTSETYRSTALEHLRHGEPDLAEQCFARLHAIAPEDVQALQFLADRHLARGDHTQAIRLLCDADRVRPDDPVVLSQLGSVQLAAGDFNAAAVSLEKALARTPQAFVTRLQLGIVLEQLGHAHEALLAYFTAVRTAQLHGRWLDDTTTAPALRVLVKHAMNYANEGRKRLFNEVLAPLRQRYGQSELARVEHCLAIYLGEQPKSIPDQRQKPKFLYFPDIPSQPFYPRDRFPWLEALEAATGAVREELRAVLSKDRQLEPFLGVQSPAEAREMLRSSNERAAVWDAYFFYRHGKRYDAHCAACPQTTSVLDTLPLVRIRDHAPETLFSVLSPGAHILPHTGVTNTRLVTHLPLIVPADCAIRVGGENHVWREGHCVTFDDTFEHEAWNRSGETRVVLILDSWNPDLSEAECLAVTDLVEAIGDFSQTAEPAPESRGAD